MTTVADLPQSFVALLLGLIEGLTEFLPVSSTGHLLLAERLLPRQSDAFNIIIQAGAVLAVLAAFRGRLAELWQSLSAPATKRLLAQLTVAFGITGVGGLALKRAGLRLPEALEPVAWATLGGGIAFLLVEQILQRRGGAQSSQAGLSWPAALSMGLGQLVAAVLPGASRSGTTILFALCLGASRPAATEFSFLLGVPTILAAATLELAAVVRHGSFEEPMLPLALAIAASLASATVVVRWLLSYVRSHTFELFGYYRIALGLALLYLLHS